MAVHKVTVAFFIDGEGRDEETVAQGVSEGVSSFGPISEAMGGFPEGQYLGGEVVRVDAPNDEELSSYTEE